MNAIDTNVLLYSVDSSDPPKQIKAQRLVHQLHAAAEPTILLWQVLGELVQQLRRWRDAFVHGGYGGAPENRRD